MATLLACIRASPLSFRTLRPLAGSRFYCDRNDGDGSDVPPKKNKLSLDELLNATKIQKPRTFMKLESVKPPKPKLPKVPDIDSGTVRLARKAAATLPGDEQKNLDDLLGQLKEVSNESKETLENLFVGMKIDRSTEESNVAHTSDPLSVDEAAHQVLFPKTPDVERGEDLVARRQRHGGSGESRMGAPFDLFAGPRLGIFSDKSQKSDAAVTCSLPVWDQLEERELKLMLTKAPKDGFDEMIQWTEQGKLWPFPIDNEYGMIEEANVKFEDHVFLDHLIEDDNAFPNGPVKQFMELVCVGLSKNPYISVERKHKCIEWYREYFTAKKGILEAALDQ